MNALLRLSLFLCTLILMIVAGAMKLPFFRSIAIGGGLLMIVWLLQSGKALADRIQRFRDRKFWQRGTGYQMILLLIGIILIIYVGVPSIFYWIGFSGRYFGDMVIS